MQVQPILRVCNHITLCQLEFQNSCCILHGKILSCWAKFYSNCKTLFSSLFWVICSSKSTMRIFIANQQKGAEQIITSSYIHLSPTFLLNGDSQATCIIHLLHFIIAIALWGKLDRVTDPRSPSKCPWLGGNVNLNLPDLSLTLTPTLHWLSSLSYKMPPKSYKMPPKYIFPY